jgi:hypothetical protein
MGRAGGERCGARAAVLVLPRRVSARVAVLSEALQERSPEAGMQDYRSELDKSKLWARAAVRRPLLRRRVAVALVCKSTIDQFH